MITGDAFDILYTELLNASESYWVKSGHPPTHVYILPSLIEVLTKENMGLEKQVLGMVVLPIEEMPENARDKEFFVAG